jgi:putative tricarboxylic transport membrane protein
MTAARIKMVSFHSGDRRMRRDQFLKGMAALAAAGALPLSARAAANIKMMIPANPGGGWDTTGRALGKALTDAKVADSVTYDNKGGAAGALGLAQFVNGSKGDPNALMVMGAVMLGGIITGKPPVNLSQATPIARLTSEYNVYVLPANSPFKTMADVVAQLKKDPGSVKWGGGSRGSTEHIAAAMLAREVGVDPAKINYVAFRGGGEATAAILGGNVTVGGSGYSEFAEYIKAGKMKAIAVTSPQRLKGIDVPTLKEQGINVELGNWRGVYGAPGITAAQRKALTDMVLAALKTKSWQEAMEKNDWTPAVMSGPAFDQFVDSEFAMLRATMVKAGMV